MADEVTHVRKDVQKSKTLFLRNLPFTTTNEKLEEIFGDIGPLKKCFVVKPKGAEKCTGFGYVAYSMLEDAEKAKDAIKIVDGRKIFISYAERKQDNRRRMGTENTVPVKMEVKDETKEDSSCDDDEEEEKEDIKVKTNEEDREKVKYLHAKTLQVSGWKEGTTQEDVQKYITKINVKGIAKLEFPIRNCDQPTALVRFKSIRDTKASLRKLESPQGKGQTLSVRSQKEVFKVVSQKSLKQSRLIVRNLSFKCTEDVLRKYFEKFGEITEAKIPLKPDGRMFGFGFVQFLDVTHANKAVNEMNMKPILGRPVAVDWTLPKNKFIAAQTNKNPAVTSTQSIKPEIKTEMISDEEPSDEESVSVASEGEKKSEENETDDVEEEAESEDESEEDDDESQSEDDGFDDEDDNIDEDEDSDLDAMDSDDSSKKKGRKKKKIKEAPRKSDVGEGRTIFIRNVGFETEEETLEEHLEEFGKINYCKILMDPNTEHSRGMAFVQFRTVEAAEKCVQKSADESRDGGITVDGRKLCIATAVSRDKAKEYKQVEKKKVEDKRNLHLIREGMIRPGTQAAQSLSKEDLQKRLKVENIKREKLKNPNVFISTTRLCVRNLPIQLTDKELKKGFLKVAGDNKAVITESRIMRDLERVSGQGNAKSRGYGFVNFTEHKHALQALREATVNSNLFNENRNLIVEFSLENKAALVAKEKKLERFMARQASLLQKREMVKEAKEKEEEEKKKGRGKQDKKHKQKDKLTDKFIGKIKHEEGSEDKKLSKSLPSHWGPKVRHKPRQSQVELEKKQKKKAKKQRQRQQKGQTTEVTTQNEGKRQHTDPDTQAPPSKKRKRPGKEKVDDFDRLVNKYKQKFISAKNTGKSSKWFES